MAGFLAYENIFESLCKNFLPGDVELILSILIYLTDWNGTFNQDSESAVTRNCT